MESERFAVLVQAYLDHALDEAGTGELATALSQDAERLDQFLDQLAVAAGCGGAEDLERLRLSLDTDAGKPALERLAQSHRFTRRRPRWGMWLAAAAAACLALAIGLLTVARSPAPAVVATGPMVILPPGLRLERAGGAGPGMAVQLRPGDRLSATEDLAAMAWTTGVTLALRSGAAIAVPEDGDLAVAAGSIEVTVTGRAPRSFRVVVPGGLITDLGTRFDVAVTGAATTVTVSEGTIEVTAADARPRQVPAGRMARLEGGAVAILPTSTSDIGSVTPPGRTIIGDGRITLSGAGADIFRTADACRYLWQEVDGDWDAVVRVESLSRISTYTKAGLMARASTAAGSSQVSNLVTPTKGTMLVFRDGTGRLSGADHGPEVSIPTWLRLSRRGSSFSASQSGDGLAWNLIGTRTIKLPPRALVGLAMSSVADGTLGTAEFSGWTITPVP